MKARLLVVAFVLVISLFVVESTAVGYTGNSAYGQEADATAGNDILQPLNLSDIPFLGVWIIDRVAGYGRVSAGEEAARKSLGEKVSFGAEDAIICNKQMKPVYYYKICISKDEFFKYHWVNSDRLGIVGPNVELIVVGSTNRLYKAKWRTEYIFVVKDEKSILVNCENVWFELVRENTKSVYTE